MLKSPEVDVKITLKIRYHPDGTKYYCSSTIDQLMYPSGLFINWSLLNKIKFEIVDIFSYIESSQYLNIPNLKQTLINILDRLLFDDSLSKNIHGHYEFKLEEVSDYKVMLKNIETEILQINQTFRNVIIKTLDPFLKAHINSLEPDLQPIISKYFSIYSNVIENETFVLTPCETIVETALINTVPESYEIFPLTLDTFSKLEEYTFGLLDCIPFENNNIIFTGGLLGDCLTRRYSTKTNLESYDFNSVDMNNVVDIDLFLYGPNSEKIKTITQIIENVTKRYPDAYAGVTRSVVYVFIPGVPRIIQLMCTSYTKPEEITNSFDFVHLMTYYDGKNIFISNQIPEIWRTKQTRMNELYSVKYNQYIRILKTLKRGYSLPPSMMKMNYVSEYESCIFKEYIIKYIIYQATTVNFYNSQKYYLNGSKYVSEAVKCTRQQDNLKHFHATLFKIEDVVLDGNFNEETELLHYGNAKPTDVTFIFDIDKLSLFSHLSVGDTMMYKLNINDLTFKINLLVNGYMLLENTYDHSNTMYVKVDDDNFVQFYNSFCKKIKELLEKPNMEFITSIVNASNVYGLGNEDVTVDDMVLEVKNNSNKYNYDKGQKCLFEIGMCIYQNKKINTYGISLHSQLMIIPL